MARLRPDIEAALEYAGRSWRVFPVRGKKPATERGFKDATTSPDRIRSMWLPLDVNGVAIRTGTPSGVVVIDIDAPAGEESLELLERQHAPLPTTVTARTGGGGRHLYFRHPGDGIRCSVAKIGKGIDVRADGGYVVAPPSLHPSGDRYEWVEGQSPTEVDLAPVPGWLLDLLTGTSAASAGSADEGAIREGTRNSTLMRHAGAMRRTGLDPQEIEAALQVVNRQRCAPPLDTEEVAKIACSAGRYPPAEEQEAGGLLTALSAREICALPEPPESAELLGPLVVRGARTVLAAHTGEGKTTLALQMAKAAVTNSSFLEWEGSGTRALVIDAEQGLRTIKRQLRQAGLQGSDQVDYVREPDGLALDENLGQVAQLEWVLEKGNYDLVVCDPLYKLHRGDSNEERPAVDLMRQLDRLRSRFGFALLICAHLRKSPQIGTKFTIHEIFGSSAYVRGAEVVLGLRRLGPGYSRLHFFKDRDGDLPVGEFWALIFDRDEGFRRDLDAEKPRETAKDKVRAILDANPGRTGGELQRAVQCSDRTVRKALKELGAEFETGQHGQRRWSLPPAADDSEEVS
jgi:hypothetical protein